jgi:hypothetical protein
VALIACRYNGGAIRQQALMRYQETRFASLLIGNPNVKERFSNVKNGGHATF